MTSALYSNATGRRSARNYSASCMCGRGGADTFYLDGAVVRLKESLAKLGSDAVIEVYPGRDHGLRDKPIRDRIDREMAERFRARSSARTDYSGE